MSPFLSSQEVSDFISKFARSQAKVLVVFLDTSSGIAFNVIGKFKVLENGAAVVSGEGDPTITESSGFNTPLANLLKIPCEFIDPRDFKNKIGFLQNEVGIDFGLRFSIPEKVFSIMLLKEPS